MKSRMHGLHYKIKHCTFLIFYFTYLSRKRKCNFKFPAGQLLFSVKYYIIFGFWADEHWTVMVVKICASYSIILLELASF